MALVVAVSSLKGGVGRTMLAANLASALVQSGRRAMAVDLDAQNALGAHFGRGPAPERGVAELHAEILPGVERGAAAVRGEAGCMPFGAATDEEMTALEARLQSDPSWLKRRIDAVTPPGCEFVVLDTPGHRSPWLSRALELADVVLAVVGADPASYLTLPAFEGLLAQTRGSRAGGLAATYVVNQFDAASNVRRDVVASLRQLFPGRVAPMVIHADEAVKDALGRQQTLFREATHSQALADIGELGEWLIGQIGAGTRSETEEPRRAAGARS